MTKQVLSIEQMHHLSKFIPLKRRTDFIWWGKVEGMHPEQNKLELHCWDTADANPECDWVFPAYTLQDILGILPTELKPAKTRYWLRIDLYDECIYYYCEDCNLVENRKKVIAYDGISGLIDAAYGMLLWCIGQGYVKPRKEERQ